MTARLRRIATPEEWTWIAAIFLLTPLAWLFAVDMIDIAHTLLAKSGVLS